MTARRCSAWRRSTGSKGVGGRQMGDRTSARSSGHQKSFAGITEALEQRGPSAPVAHEVGSNRDDYRANHNRWTKRADLRGLRCRHDDLRRMLGFMGHRVPASRSVRFSAVPRQRPCSRQALPKSARRLTDTARSGPWESSSKLEQR
jgi:hypothetical protein